MPVGAARRRLAADGVDALVRADAFGLVLDLLHGVALGEVDRNRTDLLVLFQPLGNAVHDEDLLRAGNWLPLSWWEFSDGLREDIADR